MGKRRSEVGADPKPRTKREAVKIPLDVVNEIVMLAAVIVDRAAADRYLPTITPDNFYGQGHAVAWATLQTMHAQGLTYDPATVQQMSGGAVDTAALEAYVAERPAAPPNLRYHAECLAWDRARVEATRGPVTQFLEALRDPNADPAKVRALARAIGDSFDGAGDRKYLRDPGALIREHRMELEDRRRGRAIYPYGLEGLDFYGDADQDADRAHQSRLIPGAAPGKVTLVVGVSGSGKSTTTARLALEQARQGRRVLYGAWEQEAGMTLEIVAALSLGWSRTDLMVGSFSQEDQETLLAEMERLQTWIRFFDLPVEYNQGRRTNAQNLDIIHQYIVDTAPDVFIGDLIKRVFAETDIDAEEQALWRLQSIMQKTRVHGIWLHQLRTKDVEARPDQRPTREAIKGNGAWIDVADTIIGWYRPHLHRNVPDTTLQALILKQRYGAWPLAVEFDWDAEFGHVSNGRSLQYDRPGQEGQELEGLVVTPFRPISQGGTGKRRRAP